LDDNFEDCVTISNIGTDGSGGVVPEKTLDAITSILNKIFNVIIGITMFLCFFALSSNMSANLME
jgi:hypothetical protein